MVRTTSTMLSLGSKAPDFSLTNTIDSQLVSLSDFSGNKALVVMFICNHCPYVKRIADHLAGFTKPYQEKGIAFVAVSSNEIENYPQDGPELMKQEAAERGYQFPYLFDETQDVAKAYQAACTPDFFVFNDKHELVYRGQYDPSQRDTDDPCDGFKPRRCAGSDFGRRTSR